jgi:glutathione synthase/RimK-type ligase-like ATP-grasp enzyme
LWNTFKNKLGCEDILVKPAKGNVGLGVARYQVNEENFFDICAEILMDEKDVALFQCFQKQIMTKGERGIVFVGGGVSHGIMKQPERGQLPYSGKRRRDMDYLQSES